MPGPTSTRSHAVWNVPERLPLALPQSSSKLEKLSRFTVDTLRQAGIVRNRKTLSACAEAVNYADYLWKATEKIG
jgi:Tfp pilus assembly protein PilP